MKKFFAGLFAVLLVLVLVACGSTETETGGTNEEVGTNGETEGEGYLFGYTSMTMNNPYFQVVEENIRQVVESNGDELITTDPQLDPELQINQVEDLIAQGIDAIFLNPVDWEGIRPALEMLNEAGIPIINFDAEVKDLDLVTTYVGSDNYNAGYVCGEDLVKRLPEGGKIAIIDSPTMKSIRDRVDGFKDAIEGHGFEIVEQQDAKHTLELSMQVTEDILTAHPDIVAIFAGNDPMALGALAAAKTLNNQDVIIYGVDGSPEVKAEIAEGSQIVGTGAQSPINIGRMSAEVAYKILRGEDYEDYYPVETFLINSENVNEYGVDGWQ